MRTLAAATAALSAALLLAACAGPDTVEPAAETSATPEASAQSEGTTVDTLTTCRGYYDGGDLSIHARVTEWTPAVADPATEKNASELTIVRDRIESQLRYADADPAVILREIQAPFATAIEGGSGDPAAVESSATALAALCGEAGYTVPE